MERKELFEQAKKSYGAEADDIKKKFRKNVILNGTNLQDGATAKDRNSQSGGHKAYDFNLLRKNL